MQNIAYYKKNITIDILLFVGAVTAPCVAFYLDISGITKDLFVRSGAITTLFAVFLEFRTHDVQEHESLIVIWRNIGALVEELSRIEVEIKAALNQILVKVQSEELEGTNNKANGVNDSIDPEKKINIEQLREFQEKIKLVQKLPPTESLLLKYSRVFSIISKSLVLFGTLIWAFGDILVLRYYA